MAEKSEKELAASNLDLWKRASTAASTNNAEYAISLIRNLLKTEPAFLTGRKKLRQLSIHKFNALSSLSKQTLGLKTGAQILKAGSMVKKSPLETLDVVEEVLLVDPFSPKANEILAQAGTALKMPELVAFGYETICEGKQDDPETFRKLAEVYTQQEKWDQAREAYERLLKLNPLDGDALSAMKNVIAKLAHVTGGWDKGDYREQLRDKGEAEALEQLNKVVKSQDVINSQIQDLSAKVQADPANLNWPKQIGALYVQLEDYENAVAWYQYAYEAGGKVDSALEKKVGELTLKNLDKNIEAYRAAAEADPETYKEYFDSLVTARKQFVLETARNRVERYPTEYEFHYQLGKAYVDLEMYKEALQPLQQGAKSPSVRIEALNLIGYCQWKRNMLDMAEKTFTNAATEITTMTDLKKEVLYNLADVLDTAGKKEASIEKLKEIYEVDMAYRDVAKRVEDSYGGN